MKIFIKAFLSLFILLTAQDGFAHDASIIATVNDRVITTKDFENRLNMALAASGKSAKVAPREIKEQVLELMISEEVQLLLGEEFGLKINAPVLAAAISDIERQNGMQSGELRKTLEAKGVPFSVMEKHIKATIIWREYISARYGNLVQVSEHDIKRALNEKESARSEMRLLVNEIVVPFAKGASDAQTLAKANTLHAQLNNGAQFTMLANQMSASPSALRGGDLGWVPLSKLPLEARTALSQTGVGKITAPIKTARGYEIYLVRDRLAAGENARPTDYISLRQVFFQLPRDAFEFELRDKMKKIEMIAGQIRSARMVEQLTSGKDVKIQEVENVPLANLPPELRALIGKTAVGRATKPVFTGDGALLFVVSDRKTVNPSDVTEADVRAQLMESRLQNVAAKELRHRRALAHVKVNKIP